MYKKRRRKLNKKFFIITGSAVILTAAVVLFLIFGLTKTGQAKQGSITFKQDFESIIIRNEEVYETDAFNRVNFIAKEGQTVVKDDPLLYVYKLGYNYKNADLLASAQKRIKDYIENDIKDINNAEYDEINTRVNQKAQEAYLTVSGEKDSDVIQLERELRSLLQERLEFLRNYGNPGDAVLKDFDETEKKLNEKIEDAQQEEKAKQDGVISFYFDNLEAIMDDENISTLTIQHIDDAMKGITNATLTDASTKKPLYRIVNPNDWYIMLLTSKPIKELAEGTPISVVFEDIAGKQYSASIKEGREDPKGYIYVAHSTDDIGELLCTRKAKATVVKSYSGIMVPSSAVKEKNGTNYVNIKLGDGSVKMVPVNVLITNSDGTIVAPISEDADFSANSTILY